MISTPDKADLPRTARMLLELSRTHCDDQCRAYHGIWGFQRLYGTLPSVARDHSVLLGRLRKTAENGTLRVLISGSADQGILAYVIKAFGDAGAPVDVCVADACRTPLIVNEWYGARRGVPVTTFRGDIRSFVGRGFDLVIAHNFLNFLVLEERVAVARIWMEALRPGGHALLFSRIKPGAPLQSRRFDEDGEERLVADLLADRFASPFSGMISARDLEDLARAYARGRISRNVRSSAELAEPIEAAGFEVISLESHVSECRSAGATVRSDRRCLLARRPFS